MGAGLCHSTTDIFSHAFIVFTQQTNKLLFEKMLSLRDQSADWSRNDSSIYVVNNNL